MNDETLARHLAVLLFRGYTLDEIAKQTIYAAPFALDLINQHIIKAAALRPAFNESEARMALARLVNKGNERCGVNERIYDGPGVLQSENALLAARVALNIKAKQFDEWVETPRGFNGDWSGTDELDSFEL